MDVQTHDGLLGRTAVGDPDIVTLHRGPAQWEIYRIGHVTTHAWRVGLISMTPMQVITRLAAAAGSARYFLGSGAAHNTITRN
jgi:hypothetical protein